MAEGSRSMGRRRLLTIGAVGGVAAIAPQSPVLAGEADGEAGARRRQILGEVVRAPSGDVGMAVIVDGDPVEVQPLDFPEGWAFQVGDLLAVDTESRQAFPYVRTDTTQNDVLVALNVDPSNERVFASGPG